MKSLLEYINEASEKKIGIGHFNISDLAGLKAIFGSAKTLGVPVIIGLSEGEREFVGVREASALVKNLREEYDYPIFINADHTYSLEKIKEAVAAGFDMVIFDGAKLALSENIQKTKEVVEYVKSKSSETGKQILVEGELGYIGTSSKILDKLPEGAAVGKDQFTKPEEAARFVRETGAHLFAPAVGNIHGMLSGGYDPDLDIALIKSIREAAGVPLVLHGGSGLKDEEFVKAVQAGMAIVHINTELRVAWRKEMESSLASQPKEVTPYKLLLPVVSAVSEVVAHKLKLFNGIK